MSKVSKWDKLSLSEEGRNEKRLGSSLWLQFKPKIAILLAVSYRKWTLPEIRDIGHISLLQAFKHGGETITKKCVSLKIYIRITDPLAPNIKIFHRSLKKENIFVIIILFVGWFLNVKFGQILIQNLIWKRLKSSHKVSNFVKYYLRKAQF